MELEILSFDWLQESYINNIICKIIFKKAFIKKDIKK